MTLIRSISARVAVPAVRMAALSPVVRMAALLPAAALMAALLPAAAQPARAQTGDDLLCPDQAQNTEQFADVADGDYGAAYILCAKALQLAQGTGDDDFDPTGRLTRAQMATFLTRLWRDTLDKTCPSEPAHQFTDVDENSVHAAGVACLYALGIAKGKTTSIYDPTDHLITSQITRFTARLLNKIDDNTCADIHTADDELTAAAECLTAANIAPSTTEAQQNTPTTRAQMAVYLTSTWHKTTQPHNPPNHLTNPSPQHQTPASPPAGRTRVGLKPMERPYVGVMTTMVGRRRRRD